MEKLINLKKYYLICTTINSLFEIKAFYYKNLKQERWYDLIKKQLKSRNIIFSIDDRKPLIRISPSNISLEKLLYRLKQTGWKEIKNNGNKIILEYNNNYINNKGEEKIDKFLIQLVYFYYHMGRLKNERDYFDDVKILVAQNKRLQYLMSKTQNSKARQLLLDNFIQKEINKMKKSKYGLGLQLEKNNKPSDDYYEQEEYFNKEKINRYENNDNKNIDIDNILKKEKKSFRDGLNIIKDQENKPFMESNYNQVKYTVSIPIIGIYDISDINRPITSI